ncbi:MAG: beta-galactosidase trimerization domain-containing protein [Melioribacteraceae bacterium]|nr:beta-galactosidase trimerization domain-containing protein [Melioribacteraceae bacterium]
MQYFRVFADKGISHVFIVEDDLLTEKLNEFDLIILPRIPLLSSEKRKMLWLNLLRRGGKLIVLGETGIKDQYNLTNKNIPSLEAAELSDYPIQNTSK